MSTIRGIGSASQRRVFPSPVSGRIANLPRASEAHRGRSVRTKSGIIFCNYWVRWEHTDGFKTLPERFDAIGLYASSQKLDQLAVDSVFTDNFLKLISAAAKPAIEEIARIERISADEVLQRFDLCITYRGPNHDNGEVHYCRKS